MDKKYANQDNLKVDIGCGDNKKKGLLGVDKFDYPAVDIKMDLDKKWKFKDNSVSLLYTSHFLEHVDNLEFVMEEIYRVCKPNAKIIIKVPHFSGKSGFFEFHRRFFRYNSFEDLHIDPKLMKVSHTRLNFKIINRRLIFLKKWSHPFSPFIEPLINISPRVCSYYEESFLRNLFPAHEVFFELRVIK